LPSSTRRRRPPANPRLRSPVSSFPPTSSRSPPAPARSTY
jgi:hypothetical protein